LPPCMLAASEVTSTGYPRILIGPGDLLDITVYGEKDLPTSFLVDSDGNIVFPLVGSVFCAGTTQAQMSQNLATALGAYLKNPQVTVLIHESNSYNISVIGQVARPGKYPIRGKPNLLSALSEAGGPLENAELSESILIHGNYKQEVDLERYLQGKGAIQDPLQLYPGDVLMIPKSPWPSIGEWGIIAGILSSAVLISTSLKNR